MSAALLALFIFYAFTTNAATYYFSANSGNDIYSNLQAQSPLTPWQTLTKFNSVFTSLQPGDSVLFKRGETFYGSLTISRSGTAALPIIIGAYGAGANPIITGFTTVSAWTNLGGNIWQSTSAVSTLPTCNMVVINGINTPVGRLPNTGYYTYQSHTGTTSITSSSLSGTPNWTGAEVVIRSVQWILNRATISSQSSGTLTFPSISHTPTDGFGFFIQNDVRTLDQQNEWYYNPSTKKLGIYSTSNPGTVLASSIDQLATIGGAYITIENISFTGANKNAIYDAITNTNNLTVQNCSINFSGICGVDLANLSHFTITNSTIENSNNIAIRLEDSDPYATIRGNAIHNIGVIPGAGRSGFSGYSGISSVTPGTGLTVEYNSIINTGYIGINFSGDSVLIKNNFIDTFCTILQDGGGIYTQHSNFMDRVIEGNIVLNGIGDNSGTNSTDLYAQGIFVDGGEFVTIKNNTVAQMSASGIFLNGASNINVLNNTVYDIRGLGFSRASISFSRGGSIHIRDLLIKHNIFFQKEVQKDCWFFYSSDDDDADLIQYGVADSNYYLRPIDDDSVFRIRSTQHGFPGEDYTLGQWKTFSGQEDNSNASPMTISDVGDLRFEYNATNAPVVIELPFNYMDARGVEYDGEITLQPYTSAVLIENGAASGNQSPTADAGSDISITLPTSSTTLSGSGDDSDGTISTYAWSYISGPAIFTLDNPNSARCGSGSLVQGTYIFRLTVTDNNGAAATDDITVTVNAAPNQAPTVRAGNDINMTIQANSTTLNGNTSTDADRIIVSDNSGAAATNNVTVTVNAVAYVPNQPPVANACPDQTLATPANSATLDGNASYDPDGTISSYRWQQISGPGISTFSSTTAVKITVSNLQNGTYSYRLIARDNRNATDTATLNVTILNNFQIYGSVTLYPNPANDMINVVLNNDSACTVRFNIYDMRGRQMMPTLEIYKPAGFFTATISVSQLRSGTYILDAIANKYRKGVSRFVKL